LQVKVTLLQVELHETQYPDLSTKGDSTGQLHFDVVLFQTVPFSQTRQVNYD